ncbi:hypothetical protein PLESTB_000589500 [Pleodorina starrii]|uniref:Uncharacterized protein n=1 Tax=Pleodorina starrii TaxID=330485 RepID=A0A9W6BHE1_9CHLO|nr:hypothetical protein PLESTB_000589500 [Pleodorina starrii]GLC75786.1 hypothetical protein PLESTF_001687300 [Pleodorina starrii]
MRNSGPTTAAAIAASASVTAAAAVAATAAATVAATAATVAITTAAVTAPAAVTTAAVTTSFARSGLRPLLAHSLVQPAIYCRDPRQDILDILTHRVVIWY